MTRQLIYKYPTIRFSSALTYKLNNRLTIESGIVLSDLSYNLKDNRLGSKNVLFNYLNDNGSTNFFQAYAQLLAKLSSKIKTTIGVHQYKFLLNDATALEPRWALHIESKWGGIFSTGVGVHSRLEPVSVYLFKRYAANGTFTQPCRCPGYAVPS